MAGVIRLTPAAAIVVLVGVEVESGALLEWVGLSRFEKSLGGDGCGGM